MDISQFKIYSITGKSKYQQKDTHYAGPPFHALGFNITLKILYNIQDINKAANNYLLCNDKVE